MKLTKNFSLDEFLTSQHMKKEEIEKFLTDEIKENIFLLSLELQKIRDYIQIPIIITSGFRPPPLNEKIGGSPNSLHLKGKACDFTFKTKNPTQYLNKLALLIEEDKLNFGELIIYLTPQLEFSRIHFSIPSLSPLKLKYLLLSVEKTKAYTPITTNFLKNFENERKKYLKT